MPEQAQAACGAVVSICSLVVSFFTAWMPVLQGMAVLVAIVSGVFAIAVSIKTLRK